MSEMRQLTDKELDTVCGGHGFSISDSFNWAPQTQSASQVAQAVVAGALIGSGGNATAQNLLSQTQSISF
jgi:hypothetical protein